MSSLLKNEIIRFIEKNTHIQPNSKFTFKDIEQQLNDIKYHRQSQLHHDEWYDDEILEQIEEYLEYIKPKIRKQEENKKTAKMVSIVSRRHKLPLDIEREIQSHLIEKGGMKKKSRKESNTRKLRATRKRRKQ
jgi:hypothetical protein